jgi:hypothetical protein
VSNETITAARLCPTCGKNELPPRCRKCDDCLSTKSSDGPSAEVVQMMTRASVAAASVPVGYDPAVELATLREAVELGLIDRAEQFRLGSLILMAGCPDAFAVAR